MNATSVVSILDRLLAEETRSLLSRLDPVTVFVSWSSADDVGEIRRMIAEEREHREWLVEQIVDLGGYPSPTGVNSEAGALHYLELHQAIPVVLRDKERLIGAYESALTRVSSAPAAASVVAAILGRHRAHADGLRALVSRSRSERASLPSHA